MIGRGSSTQTKKPLVKNEQPTHEKKNFQDAEEGILPSCSSSKPIVTTWPKPQFTPGQITTNFIPAGACSAPIRLPKVYRKYMNDKTYGSNANQKVCSGRGKIIIERLNEFKTKKQTINEWEYENITILANNLDIDKENTVNIGENETKSRCDCDNCDSFITCKDWIQRNTKFDLSNLKNVKKGPNFLNIVDCVTVSSLQSVKDSEIFIEGQNIPKPVSEFKDSCFKEVTVEALKQINCYQPNKTQSYMWCAILRRLNVFIIAPKQSGKSIAYIPPLCAIALNIDEGDEHIFKWTGPIILIVCASQERCQIVHCLIKKIYKNGSILNKHPIFHVTTPDKLEADLKNEKVKLKSVYHVVLDRADYLLKTFKNIPKILHILNVIQSERPCNKSLQIIVTAELWTIDLEYLLKRLHIIPIVCFEDYMEAALYSKTKLVKKKFYANLKKCYLVDVLKSMFTVRKTIIFCNDDDIPQLADYLQMNGIENLVITTTMDKVDRESNQTIWILSRPGHHKVLLCCDELFNATELLTKAVWLVHYSLPDDLNQFRKRFRSLSHNLQSPLISNIDNDKKFFVIMDEKTDCESYSKLIDDIIVRNFVSHLKFDH